MPTEPEENKENPEAEEPKGDKPAAKSSGILKYAVIGGGAFLLVVLIAVGSVLLLKEDPPEITESSEALEETQSPQSAGDSLQPASDKESILALEDDPTVIENIKDNLAFLDYVPEFEEMETGEAEFTISAEDSIAEVNWLEQEKTALAQKEQELNARQAELESLDKEVSRKLLVLEQAQTSRVNNLAKLYDGMDPRAVAQLMANLDNETVVAILPRMKAKNASAVLELVPPKRAAKLSKQMITIAEK